MVKLGKILANWKFPTYCNMFKYLTGDLLKTHAITICFYVLVSYSSPADQLTFLSHWKGLLLLKA